jgi:hypothetical protein
MAEHSTQRSLVAALQREGQHVLQRESTHTATDDLPNKHNSSPQNGTKKNQTDFASRHQYGSQKTFHGTNSNSALRRPSHQRSWKVPPCQVHMDDFFAFLQLVDNEKFKVHKPGCMCPKMKSLRERISDHSPQLQGLVVVPDSGAKFLPHVFLHPVSENANLEDKEALLSMELRLKDVIFPENAPTPDIKVSCASCLLEHIPNGFVCINSNARSRVESARDLAQRNASALLEAGKKLHADHAHHVVVLDSKHLPAASGASRGKKQRHNENLNHMKVLREMLENEGIDMAPVTSIVLGHHIKSLLQMMKRKEFYFLAIVFENKLNDGSLGIEIDLPGGKRHLGEGSFDCAIRETLEETSLLVDIRWHKGDGQPLKNTSRDDFCNSFYDLHPQEENQPSNVDQIGKSLSKIQIS